jgi:hypothetical protein
LPSVMVGDRAGISTSIGITSFLSARSGQASIRISV